ncbi:MAG: hypothetical protein K1X35_03275 [Caulobacteraceae bacterium]|nr:hypothetical protein [Caulobacteraceae bacterium]
MAEQPTVAASSTTTTEKSGGAPWLAFLVGGLLVVVAIIAWYMMSGGQVEQPAVQVPDSVDVNINAPEAPALPDAPSPAPQN